ncbi:MAG TPA: hypothetical protein VFB59_05695 [Candidatus Saccharimonadales bacterium]|nr:hypothetical protein [Candidatus Saccharimonadales bacterium]
MGLHLSQTYYDNQTALAYETPEQAETRQWNEDMAHGPHDEADATSVRGFALVCILGALTVGTASAIAINNNWGNDVIRNPQVDTGNNLQNQNMPQPAGTYLPEDPRLARIVVTNTWSQQ